MKLEHEVLREAIPIAFDRLNQRPRFHAVHFGQVRIQQDPVPTEKQNRALNTFQRNQVSLHHDLVSDERTKWFFKPSTKPGVGVVYLVGAIARSVSNSRSCRADSECVRLTLSECRRFVVADALHVESEVFLAAVKTLSNSDNVPKVPNPVPDEASSPTQEDDDILF